MCFNRRKGRGDVGKSTTGNHKLGKNQCTFWKKGQWRIDCPRLKKEKGQKSKANFTRVDDGTDSVSSVFSLYYLYYLLFRGI